MITLFLVVWICTHQTCLPTSSPPSLSFAVFASLASSMNKSSSSLSDNVTLERAAAVPDLAARLTSSLRAVLSLLRLFLLCVESSSDSASKALAASVAGSRPRLCCSRKSGEPSSKSQAVLGLEDASVRSRARLCVAAAVRHSKWCFCCAYAQRQ
jgi:hypothetical protein